MHKSLKFVHEKSIQSISYLDILVYNDKNRHPQTTHTETPPTHTTISITDLLTPNISKIAFSIHEQLD